MIGAAAIQTPPYVKTTLEKFKLDDGDLIDIGIVTNYIRMD